MSAQANTARSLDAHPLRKISFGDPVVSIEQASDGTIYLRPSTPLGDYPRRLTDRLHHWASEAPDRTFMAERVAGGGWRQVSYGELLTASRYIASALLARGLSADRPVVILSGNSIDHALVAFGALYAGIPFCPVSPAYSLVSRDYGKLAYVMKLLTPGLVFADDADKFSAALANVPQGTEIAASFGAVPGRDVTELAHLLSAPLHPDLDAVHEAIGPDTIAKFLLTSGSTGSPKAVINTQRMLCANQVMVRETMSFLKDEPPVIVDWLPWSHTFGGNHNIGLTLFNGGSMYLDQGKPMPGGIEDLEKPARDLAHGLFQRAERLRIAVAVSARRRGASRQVLRAPARDVLRRRRALALRLEQPRRIVGQRDRPARADADRPRLDRNRAVLHVGQPGNQPLRPYRPSRVRL